MNYGRETDSELIDISYAALVGEASWMDFLDALSDKAPDGRTILFSLKANGNDDNLAVTTRFDQAEIEAYASHYVHTNPWLEHCVHRKIGAGVYSDEIVPLADLERTEFFNDWMKPNDVSCSIGVTIDKHGECPLIVSTVTSRANVELNRQFADQLTRIAPHLRRAASFYRKAPSGWSSYELGLSLIDEARIGVMILGEDCRLKRMSKAAEEAVERGDVAVIAPLGGRVTLRSRDAQTILRSMVRRTYDGPTSIRFAATNYSLSLVRVQKDDISLLLEGPTVLVLIEASIGRGSIRDLGHFKEVYGLTPAEQRAMLGIITGKSVTEIAEEASLSRETIRTQLKSLYTKTGVRGQNDLLRLFGAAVGFEGLGPLLTRRSRG